MSRVKPCFFACRFIFQILKQKKNRRLEKIHQVYATATETIFAPKNEIIFSYFH